MLKSQIISGNWIVVVEGLTFAWMRTFQIIAGPPKIVTETPTATVNVTATPTSTSTTTMTSVDVITLNPYSHRSFYHIDQDCPHDASAGNNYVDLNSYPDDASSSIHPENSHRDCNYEMSNSDARSRPAMHDPSFQGFARSCCDPSDTRSTQPEAECFGQKPEGLGAQCST